jgi:hypothetical protein
MKRKDPFVERFRAELPGLPIRPTVKNGAERRKVETTPRDGRNAIANDVCHCTMSNAATRSLKVPAALFERTAAYLLEPCGGGYYEVVKYVHDGAAIADALDLHGVGVPRATVTLRPPSRFRRVGAQTAAQKARKGRKRKPPQTKEHIGKRADAIRKVKQTRRRRVAFGK